MNRNELIFLFSQFGKIFDHISQKTMYPTTGLCINKDEYDSLQQKIEQTHLHNAWFTFENIRLSFESFATWLHYDTLIQWSSPYSFAEKPKKVGLIMAGNIPMVGFHDFFVHYFVWPSCCL